MFFSTRQAIFSSLPGKARIGAAMAGAALLLMAGQAHAGTVIATFLGADPAGGLVQRSIVSGPGAPQLNSTQDPERFLMNATGGSELFRIIGNGIGAQFYAFCIEPRQFIDNSSIAYDLVPLSSGTTNIGGMGATKADQITELFGRYAPNLNAPMTSLKATALQIAIWEIVRETPGDALDVTSGNIYFTTPESPSGAIALAQTYVQSIDGTGPRAIGLMALDNGIFGDPSTSAGTQDLLVQTPEPTTLAVLGFGLTALIGARRTRRTRA